MSRGPGRMMRAALADIAECGYTEPSNVATYAAHDSGRCQCGRPWHCSYKPGRAELVSARRALHSLAERGEVGIIHVQPAPDDKGSWALMAFKCCSASREHATLKLPPKIKFPTLRQFRAAVNDMLKRCPSVTRYGSATLTDGKP
jgi:hypothetical protein